MITYSALSAHAAWVGCLSGITVLSCNAAANAAANAEAKAEAEVEAESVFFDQSSHESQRRHLPPLNFTRRLIKGPGLNI